MQHDLNLGIEDELTADGSDPVSAGRAPPIPGSRRRDRDKGGRMQNPLADTRNRSGSTLSMIDLMHDEMNAPAMPSSLFLECERSNTKHPRWMRGKITRENADRELRDRGMPDGAFVIREKIHSAERVVFALSYVHGKKITHHLLARPRVGAWSFDDKPLPWTGSLEEVIRSFQKKVSVLHCLLEPAPPPLPDIARLGNLPKVASSMAASGPPSLPPRNPGAASSAVAPLVRGRGDPPAPTRPATQFLGTQWTVDDVCKWLTTLGLGRHGPTFRAQRLTGRMLLVYPESRLRAIINSEHDFQVSPAVPLVSRRTTCPVSVTHIYNTHTHIYVYNTHASTHTHAGHWGAALGSALCHPDPCVVQVLSKALQAMKVFRSEVQPTAAVSGKPPARPAPSVVERTGGDSRLQDAVRRMDQPATKTPTVSQTASLAQALPNVPFVATVDPVEEEEEPPLPAEVARTFDPRKAALAAAARPAPVARPAPKPTPQTVVAETRPTVPLTSKATYKEAKVVLWTVKCPESRLKDACKNGDYGLICSLLGNVDLRVDAVREGGTGKTALFAAADFGYVRIVQRLLEYGANPLRPSATGITPLQVATGKQHIQIVRMMREVLARPPPETLPELEPIVSPLPVAPKPSDGEETVGDAYLVPSPIVGDDVYLSPPQAPARGSGQASSPLPFLPARLEDPTYIGRPSLVAHDDSTLPRDPFPIPALGTDAQRPGAPERDYEYASVAQLQARALRDAANMASVAPSDNVAPSAIARTEAASMRKGQNLALLMCEIVPFVAERVVCVLDLRPALLCASLRSFSFCVTVSLCVIVCLSSRRSACLSTFLLPHVSPAFSCAPVLLPVPRWFADVPRL